MNGFVGSSFYDTINKLLIGFLLLLPFLLLSSQDKVPSAIAIPLIAIACWIVGLFVWGIGTYLILPLFRAESGWRTNTGVNTNRLIPHAPTIVSFFRNNDLSLINLAYFRLLNRFRISYPNPSGTDGSLLEIDYLRAYYEVQDKGLLGNVGQLESFSAFFRNFSCVVVYWWLITPILLLLASVSIGELEVYKYLFGNMSVDKAIGICIIVSITVLLLCINFRHRTEISIHSLILEAYLLTLPQNVNPNQNTTHRRSVWAILRQRVLVFWRQ